MYGAHGPDRRAANRNICMVRKYGTGWAALGPSLGKSEEQERGVLRVIGSGMMESISEINKTGRVNLASEPTSLPSAWTQCLLGRIALSREWGSVAL